MKPTGYLVAVPLLGAAELIGASTVQAVAVDLGSPGIRRTWDSPGPLATPSIDST